MNDPQAEGHMASHIGRRKFLATLGGAAAWPLAAVAESTTQPIQATTANPPQIEVAREAYRPGGKASVSIKRWVG
jgi:hypothetical protein